MKKLILTAALGSAALFLSGCGDTDADTEEADTAVVETDTEPAATTAAADSNWPAGTGRPSLSVTIRLFASGARLQSRTRRDTSGQNSGPSNLAERCRATPSAPGSQAM